MKKKIATMMICALMVMAMCLTAFAGQWKSNANGWWWENDDGSYFTNEWQWIDGDGDGISECYYFDGNGYCLINTTTPDGYQVDHNGAWVVGGDVQKKGAPVSAPEKGGSSTRSSVSAVRLRDLKPVASSNYSSNQTNVTISYNDLIWSEPIKISASGYVEFAADGLYNELAFTLSFQKSILKAGTATVRVYGDNDQILWEYTTEAGYGEDNKPKDFSVNITGQKSVKIQYTNPTNVGVLLNNAEFK